MLLVNIFTEIHQFRVLELKSYYRRNDDWSNSNTAKVSLRDLICLDCQRLIENVYKTFSLLFYCSHRNWMN